MNGVSVSCRGGISAISAFATGRGASAGIDLPLTVHMEEGRRYSHPEVLPTLDFLDSKFGRGTDFHVEIDSWIPSSMGLKSSSAFTLGLVLSYTLLNGIELEDIELLRTAAEASIRNGTSITGALDDLCASYYGGLCLTDNRNGKILMRKDLPEYPLLIMFSDQKIRTGNLKNMDFSSLSRITEGMEGMVMAGRTFETMCLNGFLYGSILGIDSRMVGRLYEENAMYAGQSGKGPSLFAVFRTFEDAELAREEIRMPGYNGIVTRFSNEKAVVEID